MATPMRCEVKATILNRKIKVAPMSRAHLNQGCWRVPAFTGSFALNKERDNAGNIVEYDAWNALTFQARQV